MELEGFADVSGMLQGGVYALVLREVVVYVGKSKMMLSRIYSHRSAWGRKSQKALGLKPIKGILFDAIWVRACPSAEVDDLERAMINLYKPRYNDKLRNGLPVDISALIAGHLGGKIPSAPAQNQEMAIRRRIV